MTISHVINKLLTIVDSSILSGFTEFAAFYKT